MLEQLNRYGHGYVALPVIFACREQGLFETLKRCGALTVQQLAEALGANEGYLAVALNLLESVSWLIRDEQDRYVVTEAANLNAILPIDCLELLNFPFDNFLNDGIPTLAPWLERSRAHWNLPPELPIDWVSFLDGLIMVPLMVNLQRNIPEVNLSWSNVIEPVHSDARKVLEAHFAEIGWLYKKDTGQFELDTMSRYLFSHGYNNAAEGSYLPLLKKMPDVLFGDADAVYALNSDGSERHVNRTLNVKGSGFQHRRYFQELTESLADLFNQEPLDTQPKAIVDMGCGDGQLLNQLYDYIAANTHRGSELARNPLTLIGADINDAALDATRDTLEAAGLPHILLKGDIGNPVALMRDLQQKGFELDDVLHVRSFLDHDRPFMPPTQEFDDRGLMRSLAVAGDGHLISGTENFQSLVEHFKRWQSVMGCHGLTLLEVHSLSPKAIAANPNTESLSFDPIQAFSHQYLVPPEQFLSAAAQAGLFSLPRYARQFPRLNDGVRITLHHLKKRPYIIRLATKNDLNKIVTLESLCFKNPGLRYTKSEVNQLIDEYSQGQWVLELAGELIGTLSTQRIAQKTQLEEKTFKTVLKEHKPNGSYAHLLKLNIHPDHQGHSFGDELLEFGLHYYTLLAGVNEVVGVTLCKQFNEIQHETLADYITQVDESGLPSDPILRLHTVHGAKIEGLIADYRPEDRKNKGYGVQISYDLQNRLSNKPKISPSSQALLTESEIIDVIAECRRRDPETILLDESLLLAGFDSVDLTTLRVHFERRIGQPLSASFFFKYQTPREIVASLLAHQAKASARGSTTSTLPPIPKQENASKELNTDISNITASLLSGVGKTLNSLTEHSSFREVHSPRQWRKLQSSETSQYHNDSQSKRLVSEPLAIIGCACRFPGDITDLESLWRSLNDAQDLISTVPANRWSLAQTPHRNARWGGFLSDIDQFDAAFFDLKRAEAESLDPQQRLLLELTWQALEEAGHNPFELLEKSVGIYLGLFADDYKLQHVKALNEQSPPPYYATGTSNAVAAGRIAHFLGTQGPTLTVDTACSSSLVALHLAQRSLLSCESEIAIVGGVNLIISPEYHQNFAELGMLAKDGHCKTFSADADGYVRSDGGAVVVVKRLSDAELHGDRILGLIEASVVNHDGVSSTLTAPNPEAQQVLLRQALEQAKLKPEDIDYLEAHGTGTALGDPIEVAGITKIYGEGCNKRQTPLNVGSVKAHLGHTEAASGLAGLFKILTCLQHQAIPKQPHLTELNPRLTSHPYIRIAQTETGWPVSDARRRRAGLSSFGFSGTNAHMIISEPPAQQYGARVSTRPYHLITLATKKSPTALDNLYECYHNHIETHPELSAIDVAYTSNMGRAHFHAYNVRDRAAILISNNETLAQAFKRDRLSRCEQVPPQITQLTFLITGQGSQHVGMGKTLHNAEPFFAKSLDECLGILATELNRLIGTNEHSLTTLRTVLFEGPEEKLKETLFSQVAVVSIGLALADWWQHLGIQPAAVLGHSVSELVGASIAGIFNREEILRLAAARAHAMQQLKSEGGMLAIQANIKIVQEHLRIFNSEQVMSAHLHLAADNAPNQIVISGPETSLTIFEKQLTDTKLRYTRLSVAKAFHSPAMQSAADAVVMVAKMLQARAPKIPFMSTVTGTLLTEPPRPEYWGEQIMKAVLARPAFVALHELGIDGVLELGAKPHLLSAYSKSIEAEVSKTEATALPVTLPSLNPRAKSTDITPYQTLASLYEAGASINWEAFHQYHAGICQKVPLPTYPFERKRYWAPILDSVSLSKRAEPYKNSFDPLHSAESMDHQVLIIGGGAAGLAMLGRLKAHHHNDALLLEKNERIGGIWHTTHYPNVGLQAQSFSYRFYDYKAPESNGPHASAAEIRTYFEKYVTQRDLESQIGTQQTVNRIDYYKTETGDYCEVTVTDNATHNTRILTAQYVVAALGFSSAGTPHVPVFSRKEAFSGAIKHASNITETDFAQLKASGASLVILGGGKSAYDLLLECLNRDMEQQVTWVYSKALWGLNYDFIYADDAEHRTKIAHAAVLLSEYTRVQLEQPDSEAAIALARQVIDSGYLVNIDTDDVAIYRNRGAIYKPSDLSRIRTYIHHIKAEVAKLTKNTVHLSNGQELPADMLICATGYRRAANLPPIYVHRSGEKTKPYDPREQSTLFRGMIDPYIPKLALFTGHSLFYVQLYAYSLAAEWFCRWIGGNLKDRYPLSTIRQALATEMQQYGERFAWCPKTASTLSGGASYTTDVPPGYFQALVADLGLPNEIIAQIGSALANPNAFEILNEQIKISLSQALEKSLKPSTPGYGQWRLEKSQGDKMDRIQIVPGLQLPLGDQDIRVRVRAVGLNFRDVLNALDLYPDQSPLGTEAAGIVEAVGSEVKDFQSGDRVMGLAFGQLGTHATSFASHWAPVPTDWSLEEAATVPMAFLTAQACLKAAAITAFDTVLIHAGASGVGLAAVKICRALGCRVLATTSRSEKHTYLASLGVKSYPSRSTSFAEQIKTDLDVCVDVVINSLTGDGMILASLSVCRENARFVELSKLNTYTPEQMALTRPDIRYHLFTLDTNPTVIGVAWSELLPRFKSGDYSPLPLDKFPFLQYPMAFQHAQQARNIGKTVLTLPDPAAVDALNAVMQHRSPTESSSGYYQIVWKTDSSSVAKAQKLGGSCLLFATAELAEAVCKQCAHLSFIVVQPGSHFMKLSSNCYQICPKEAEDFNVLSEQLPWLGITQVVYAWTLTSKDTDALTQKPNNLATELQNWCSGLLYLIHSLPNKQALHVHLITQAAYSIQTETTQPQHAPIAHLVRTLNTEHPNWTAHGLDLDIDSNTETCAKWISQQLASPTSTAHVWAQRGQTVYRQFLVSLPATDFLVSDSAKPIFPKRTYFIAGGLGGLGLETAAWLIEQGASHIVLASRHSPRAEQEVRLKQLCASLPEGGRLQTMPLDVGDYDALKEALRMLQIEWPQLAGIFYAAGTLCDGLMRNQSWAKFETVYRGRVYGAWYLHVLTRNYNLDHFVLYSSMSALLGPSGVGEYSSACAFLDSLAYYRRHQGLPAQVINWGAWAEVGNVAGRTELNGFPTEQGIRALALTLVTNQTQLAYHDGMDWTSFLSNVPNLPEWLSAQVTARSPLPQQDENAWIEKWKALPMSQRLSSTQARIQSLLRELLDLGPNHIISLKQGLMEQGLDSLLMANLAQRLNQSFGLNVSATVGFDYSTPEALSKYVNEQLHNCPEVCNRSLMLEPKLQSDDMPAEQCLPVKSDKTDSIIAPIAVIGFDGVFPGDACTVDEFWKLLWQGRSGVTEIPKSRWDWRTHHHELKGSGCTPYAPYGGFITHPIDELDASFFDISANEARLLDPQQRLLLELTWHALEEAGIDPLQLKQTLTSVFVGIYGSTYGNLVLANEPEAIQNPFFMLGNTSNTAVGRLAYFLDLHGPNQPVDTACSSSLVALHHACNSLYLGEADLALAGGVNLIIDKTSMLGQSNVVSPTGSCKTFSKNSDGFTRGEGGGIVVLKRLDDALSDNDCIRAVIYGSAINQDGATSTLTAPSGLAQERVIRAGLKRANLNPLDISYVEAHGTGTPLGDPIEVHALGNVYGERRDPKQPFILGTAKVNIGHLESAAGVAGLIKLILQLEHGEIVPHRNFTALNPKINLLQAKARISTESVPWPRVKDKPRYAGLSAFGHSGTNAHVIVGESPLPVPRTLLKRPYQLISLSAKTKTALSQIKNNFLNHLSARPELNPIDIAYTTNVGRADFAHRLSFAFPSNIPPSQFIKFLKQAETSSLLITQLTFLITGQGSQHVGMGKHLYETEPVFAKSLNASLAQLAGEFNDLSKKNEYSLISLRATLFEDREGSLNETHLSQAAIVSVSLALADWWQHLGVRPTAVLGHGVGELVAAAVVGIFNRVDALHFIAVRAHVMKQLESKGGLLAVQASVHTIQRHLARFNTEQQESACLCIIADNAPDQVVVSGIEASLDLFSDLLSRANIKHRRLVATNILHPSKMLQAAETLVTVAKTIPAQDPHTPMISTVTGQVLIKAPGPEYWSRQLSQPVLARTAFETLHAQGIDGVLELGATPALLSNYAASVAAVSPKNEFPTTMLPSFNPVDRVPAAVSYQTLASLYQAGLAIDWHAFHQEYAGSCRKVSLPTYPFERKRFWPSLTDSKDTLEYIYQTVWNKVELSQSTSTQEGEGAWLLFGDKAVCQALQTKLTPLNRQVIVDSSVNSKKIEDTLVEHLTQVEAIIWVEERLSEFSEKDIYLSVLTIAKTLRRHRVEKVTLLLATQSTQAVDHKIDQYNSSVIWGLSQTLIAALSKINVKTVDLDAAMQPERQAEQLIQSMCDGIKNQWLAFRGNQAYARQLQTVKLKSSQPTTSLQFKSDGSYLITGGLGGIGLSTCEWLAEHGAKEIILVGRKAPSDDKAQKIARIQQAHAVKIAVYQADMSQKDSVKTLIDQLAQQHPPLKGVFHMAGSLADSYLDTQDKAKFERVFDGKALGAKYLHEILKEYKLDYFVLYSSVAAVLSSVAQANYAAANQYLCALAAYRRHLGLSAQVVCWGPWASVGMASNMKRHDKANLEETGVSLMPIASCFKSMELILRYNIENSIVVSIDWQKYIAFQSKIDSALVNFVVNQTNKIDISSLESAEVKKAYLEAPDKYPFVLSAIQSIVNDVIKSDSSIAEETNFDSLGMDSLNAAVLRNKLQQTFGLRLPIVLVADYPTPKTLSYYLIEQLNREETTASSAQQIKVANMGFFKKSIKHQFETGASITQDIYVEDTAWNEAVIAENQELISNGFHNFYIKTSAGTLLDIFDTKTGSQPVLVLNGVNMKTKVIKEQLLELQKQGYRVVHIVNMGIGRSEFNPAYIDLETVAKSYTFVTLTLTEQQSFHVLGWSQGGTIAMFMACQTPHKVISLTVLNQGIRNSDSYRTIGTKLTDHLQQEGKHPDFRNKADFLGARSPTVSLKNYEEVSDPDKNEKRSKHYGRILATLDIPIHFITTEGDKIQPLAYIQSTYRLSKNAKLTVLKGGDHYSLIFRKGEYNASIVKFIKEHDDLSHMETCLSHSV